MPIVVFTACLCAAAAAAAVQDCIDQHLISTSQQPAIKPVMGGTFVQQIICRQVAHQQHNPQLFLHAVAVGCVQSLIPLALGVFVSRSASLLWQGF